MQGKVIYYTYYSYEEWGRGYIGQRKCPIGKTPEEDDYPGSYKDKTFNPDNKIVLKTYDTREEAIQDEIILHDFYKVDTNPHFANISKQKAQGFSYSAVGTKNYQHNTGRKDSFYHPQKGEEINVTCSLMRYKYGLTTSSLLLLSKEQIREHKGWVLLKNKNNIPSTANKHYVHVWKNIDKNVYYIGTINDLVNQYSYLNIPEITRIAIGERKISRGIICIACQSAAKPGFKPREVQRLDEAYRKIALSTNIDLLMI